MIRNIRGHRIRWSVLLAQGALAGVLSSLVMLAVAMITVPMLSGGTDNWTFAKVVSTLFLGADAADPLTGFDALPVTVGLLVHFTIAIVAGALYGALVGLFDLEGWTPVAVMGLLFGAFLFVWSAVVVGAGFAPSPVADLPLGALLWGNIAFGLCQGLLLATWAERADLDRDPEDVARVRVFEGDELHTPTPQG